MFQTSSSQFGHAELNSGFPGMIRGMGTSTAAAKARPASPCRERCRSAKTEKPFWNELNIKKAGWDVKGKRLTLPFFIDSEAGT